MNKPNWINFTPSESVGGSGSGPMDITVEPNYDNTHREFSYQIKQDGSNTTKNIKVEQQYSEDIFNIEGSFAVSEAVYYVDTVARVFNVTSKKEDGTPLSWVIDNVSSIPSWMTAVVDPGNTRVTVTCSNIVAPDRDFTIILKQPSSGNIATIKIYRKRALMGYGAVSLDDGTIFIGTNEGIYSNRVNPSVFQIEDIYYDLKTDPGAFTQDGLTDATRYTWGAVNIKFKNTLFFGSAQAKNRFNGTAWYNGGNGACPRMILYWNSERNRLENVWSSIQSDGQYPIGHASSVGRFININDRVLYNVRRTSNDSQFGKATQIKQQDNSWISTPESTYTGIGIVWTLNDNSIDCIIDNTYGQEKFYMDINSSLYIVNANNDSFSGNILNGMGIPSSHFLGGLCRVDDWYYVTFRYVPSYQGAQGYVLKFQMSNGSVVSGSHTLIEITTTHGGPEQGILRHGNYIYIPLANSRYACLIIDITKDFIFSNFIFVPHNFPVSDTPSNNNTVGYSTNHPFVLDDRVYISSVRVIATGGSTDSSIDKMKGIREIVNDNGNFYQRATNKSIGFYGKPFISPSGDVYIPGDGLALKYNKSNFTFDYVNYAEHGLP